MVENSAYSFLIIHHHRSPWKQSSLLRTEIACRAGTPWDVWTLAADAQPCDMRSEPWWTSKLQGIWEVSLVKFSGYYGFKLSLWINKNWNLVILRGYTIPRFPDAVHAPQSARREFKSRGEICASTCRSVYVGWWYVMLSHSWVVHHSFETVVFPCSVCFGIPRIFPYRESLLHISYSRCISEPEVFSHNIHVSL